MSAFLRNSPQLIKLLLSCCRGISSEGFEVLVNALDGGSIKRLDLDCCNITDISALGNVTLPQLRSLNLTKNSIYNMGSVLALENYTQLTQLFLKHNKIGIEGCRTISKLLQNEETKLEWLDLENNDIDDEGFEILATSLKHNTALNTLRLLDNNISGKGLLVLLKILVDVTSIENTYNSNHTLENLLLPILGTNRKIRRHINEALTMNRCQSRKGKVIQCQLDSINRAKLAKVQGVTCTDSSVYAQIDPVVLPEVLALVGNECTHGDHDDMYCALVATAADLMSLVNKPVVLREQMHDKELEIAHRNRECKQKVDAIIAENERQTSALTAEISELNKKLQSLTQDMMHQRISNVDNDSGKKRRIDI